VDGLLGLVDGHHRLDCEQVHAYSRTTGDEAFDLFRKGGARLLQRGLSQGFEVDAKRANRAGYEGASGLLVGELSHSFPGQPRARLVDGAGLIPQAEAMQPEAVCPEGVGFDDLGAGLQILFVDGADQLRLRQVQLVEALVEEDASAIEGSAHGSVTQDGPISEQ
jgi:hypothetical protein